jgi:hypothetical protein
MPTGLTSADLSQGRLFLEQTRDCLTGSATLVTPAQWTFKPRPERWSIAEIVEHVIAVQERVIGMIRQQLASAPPPPSEQDREVVDSIVIHQIPSRLSKFPSPMTSTAELGKVEALRRYADNCAALSEMLASTPGLREHALDSPPLKAISKGAYSVMDGYQWILAAAAHAERHTKQILEVIADHSFTA